MRALFTLVLLLPWVAACTAARGSTSGTAATGPAAVGDPFPSTYTPPPSAPTVIRGGTVMTAAGEVIEGGEVLLVDGRIAAVGASVDAPASARVIDASGRWVTPGIIDTHSHLGAYPSPAVSAHSDGNEATDPNTAEVWVEHSVWPQDPGFIRALEGGITTLQILPGSANLFGGRSVTLRNVPARTVQEMKFPGAPYGLKMACGENPKRVYANRGPSTRMGNAAGFRAAWSRAQEYQGRLEVWERGARSPGNKPPRDLELETLSGVLRGEILVHNHCYRADEMAVMVDIAREFGYEIRSFHHGVEAYKIRDILAQEEIAGSLWADWWGFKMEAMDFTKANVGLVHSAGARAIVHSDDPIGIQRLNQEAAKALRAGWDAGLEIDENDALRWITANAAWALGVEEEVGTLEPGKRADVVVWSHNPFSVYARADQVFIDGALVLDRLEPGRRPRTDFEVGLQPEGINE